ncbi:hypothetical protein [Kitasatospora sp. NPDC097643]|uniref:hypothetical protein n=1 Tax=Kitasatospora sp. NPDC097643 TaxID=3157230 RepID=UPI00332183D4
MTSPQFPDPEASFEQGLLIIERHGDELDLAERHFDAALRGPDPQMPWRVAQAWSYAADGRAASMMRRAVAALNPPPGITVDPGLLPVITSDDGCYALWQDWSVTVQAEDRGRTVAALEAARKRLPFTSHDGRELTREQYDTALATESDFYNPNFVGIENKDGTPPRIWLDCKDGVYPLLAREVIRIVIEELLAAGVSRATLRTPAG